MRAAIDERNSDMLLDVLTRMKDGGHFPPADQLKKAMEDAIAASIWTTAHSTIYSAFACGAHGTGVSDFEVVVAGKGETFPDEIEMGPLLKGEEWRITFQDADIKRFINLIRTGASESPCMRFDRLGHEAAYAADAGADDDADSGVDEIKTLNPRTGYRVRLFVDEATRSGDIQDNAFITGYWQGRTDEVFVTASNVIDPSLDKIVSLISAVSGWVFSLSMMDGKLQGRMMTTTSNQYCCVTLPMENKAYNPVELDSNTKYYRYRLSMKVQWLASAIRILRMSKSSYFVWVVEELPGDDTFKSTLMRTTLIAQDVVQDYINHTEVVEAMRDNAHICSDIIVVNDTTDTTSSADSDKAQRDSDEVQCDTSVEIGGQQDKSLSDRWIENDAKIKLTVNDTFFLEYIDNFVGKVGNGVIVVRLGVGTMTAKVKDTDVQPLHMQMSLHTKMYLAAVTRTIICVLPEVDDGM